MRSFGERLFAWLVRLYPREFRERYGEDLLAFYREDRAHARYGSGPLRPLRFWTSTVIDTARAAWRHRRTQADSRRAAGPTPSRWISRLAQDVRFGWRGLWASPGVTLAAVAVLTLGIGAGTAVFSVVDAVALRGLPFPDDARLVSVAETYLPTGSPTASAYQNYADWRVRQDVFEEMAAVSGGADDFSDPDAPGDRPRTYHVTASLFDVLRARPALGRAFTAADERPGASPVAILSDGLWRRRFHADRAVLGHAIATKAGASFQVVGVMPPEFSYPLASAAYGPVDVWVPFVPSSDLLTRGRSRLFNLSVIARLQRGVTAEAASAHMLNLRDALAAEYPAWFRDRGVSVRRLQDAIVGASVRSWMLLLLGAVSLLVLMACLNAANLLLARSVVRGPELAMRTALGASRADLARSLFVESLLLTLLGTVGGVCLAIWGVDLLRTTLPATVPRLASVALDLRVLTFSVLAALVTGVAFGTIPAVQASRPDVVTLLGQSGRGHSGDRASRRLRAALVIAEVALAVVLLSGSGLFFASFVRVTSIDLGFDPRHVASFLGTVIDSRQITPPSTPEARDAALGVQVQVADALDRIRAIPGVAAAAATQGGLPLAGSWMTAKIQHADRQTPPFTGDDEAVVRSVDCAYLEVLRGTLARGRWISGADTLGAAPVVVLDDEAARRYFGSRDPIGESILIEDYARTIVGVVRAMRWHGPETDLTPEMFIPLAQSSRIRPELMVRAAGDPATLAPAVGAAISDAMPGAVVGAPKFLEARYAGLLEQRKFNMIILVLFGSVAVVIASVGLYGLMAFMVAQRRREIGVRVVLGARPAGILSMVLRGAVRLLVAGLVPGLAAAVLLERTVRAFLFNAPPHDPTVYLGVAAALLLAGLAASLGPARRALRVDPIAALRLD